jgi:hypothetical protein
MENWLKHWESSIYGRNGRKWPKTIAVWPALGRADVHNDWRIRSAVPCQREMQQRTRVRSFFRREEFEPAHAGCHGIYGRAGSPPARRSHANNGAHGAPCQTPPPSCQPLLFPVATLPGQA